MNFRKRLHTVRTYKRLARVLGELPPDPQATPHYDVMSDGLIWTDEVPLDSASDWSDVRPLFHHRARLIMGMPSKHADLWRLGLRYFPNWPGFLPERRAPREEYKAMLIVRRGTWEVLCNDDEFSEWNPVETDAAPPRPIAQLQPLRIERIVSYFKRLARPAHEALSHRPSSINWSIQDAGAESARVVGEFPALGWTATIDRDGLTCTDASGSRTLRWSALPTELDLSLPPVGDANYTRSAEIMLFPLASSGEWAELRCPGVFGLSLFSAILRARPAAPPDEHASPRE